MNGRFLGKISSAEYGADRDHTFLFGLWLSFSFEHSSVSTGGMYAENINKECKWSHEERADAFLKQAEDIDRILKDAKVNYVSELKGKPVEVVIESSTFKSFRILTEVL